MGLDLLIRSIKGVFFSTHSQNGKQLFKVVENISKEFRYIHLEINLGVYICIKNIYLHCLFLALSSLLLSNLQSLYWSDYLFTHKKMHTSRTQLDKFWNKYTHVTDTLFKITNLSIILKCPRMLLFVGHSHIFPPLLWADLITCYLQFSCLTAL